MRLHSAQHQVRYRYRRTRYQRNWRHRTQRIAPKIVRVNSMMRPRREESPHNRRHRHQENIQKSNVARRIRMYHAQHQRYRQQHQTVNNFVEEQRRYHLDRLHNLIPQTHTQRQ